MSVDPAGVPVAEDPDELRTALIVHCRLSGPQVERVDEAKKALRLSFADTAVHVGIVTQQELDRTLDFVSLTADQRAPSIVETAIRRRKPATELVVRHGDLVKPSEELILAHDSDNPRSERIRALRTELLLLDDTPSRANVLALVSPCPAEGRSLLAAELAIAFSQLRRRVLLIDADLRNPRQHMLFGSENVWGLSQTLGLKAAPRLLGVEGLPQLSILTAGPTVPNPLELLSDGRFSRLVDDWRYNFDDIVIDTPPVSRYADGLTVATIATRALVLSRAAVTPRNDMKNMMRRLANTQARIMGAVLSTF